MATGHGPVKKSLWTSYELLWKPTSDDFLELTGDFWLTQYVEHWLMELTHLNTDDLSKVDKEWWIFHITQGHIFIFLHLVASDLQPRIRYPLKMPGCGWADSPIPSALCTEHSYNAYWDFRVKIQELQLKPVLSESHQRIVNRAADKKES